MKRKAQNHSTNRGDYTASLTIADAFLMNRHLLLPGLLLCTASSDSVRADVHDYRSESQA